MLSYSILVAVGLSVMFGLWWIADDLPSSNSKSKDKPRKPTKCKQYGCGGRSACVVDSTYECKLYIKKPIPKPNTKPKMNAINIIHTACLMLLYLWAGYLFGSFMRLIMFPHVFLGFVCVLVVALISVLTIDAIKWFANYEV